MRLHEIHYGEQKHGGGPVEIRQKAYDIRGLGVVA